MSPLWALMKLPTPPRIRLLGAEVDLITPNEVMSALDFLVLEPRASIVANHNTYSLSLLRRQPQLRRFFEAADIIEIDSTVVISWARLLGLPARQQHRSTYLDWRDAFWAKAGAKGWRVYLLGGRPGVAERAGEHLLSRWPGTRVKAHHGYFDTARESTGNEAVLADIRAFDPDIILVGMGMPRQEAWILDNHRSLGRGVLLSVGAAIDYEAGVQKPAPRWLGRCGLEWLYRLIREPRRLARRYLVDPWILTPEAASDVAASLRRLRRRFSLERPA